MNRILRPAGYLILSSKHDSIEEDEAMSKLTVSLGWNILAHKTDDVSDIGIRIFQKPESNDIYALRRKKVPPMCKDNENPDAAWYAPINSCLHPLPSAIEDRGTEWPEEWPKRLQTFPDWMNNRDKLVSDTEHRKAIVDKSYLNGMGINWSTVRNVMDIHAIFGRGLLHNTGVFTVDELTEMIQRHLEETSIKLLDKIGLDQLEQQLNSFLQQIKIRKMELKMGVLKALQDQEMQLKNERKYIMDKLQIMAAGMDGINNDSDAAEPQPPVMGV